MHTKSYLNLLRCGCYFCSTFVHHDSRQSGLTNRNTFHQENSCIMFCGLCQWSAKQV